MAFDKNRIAEVGAFQNNSALNCLAHVLLSNSTDTVGVPKPAQDSILKAFNKKHGTIFTFAEMIAHLKGLTPSERETKFSPVLRSIFGDAYQAARLSNRNVQEMNKERLEELINSNTMIMDDELNYLAHFLHMNVESYVGTEQEDRLAVRGPNPFRVANPIAILKTWMPTEGGNHYSFEAPQGMDVQAHNAAIQAAIASSDSSGSAGQNVLEKMGSLISGMFGGQANGLEGSGILNSLLSFIGPMLKMFADFSGLFKKLEEESSEQNEIAKHKQESDELKRELELKKLSQVLTEVDTPTPVQAIPEQQLDLERLNKAFIAASDESLALVSAVPTITPALEEAVRREELTRLEHSEGVVAHGPAVTSALTPSHH